MQWKVAMLFIMSSMFKIVIYDLFQAIMNDINDIMNDINDIVNDIMNDKKGHNIMNGINIMNDNELCIKPDGLLVLTFHRFSKRCFKNHYISAH